MLLGRIYSVCPVCNLYKSKPLLDSFQNRTVAEIFSIFQADLLIPIYTLKYCIYTFG